MHKTSSPGLQHHPEKPSILFLSLHLIVERIGRMPDQDSKKPPGRSGALSWRKLSESMFRGELPVRATRLEHPHGALCFIELNY